MIHLHGGPMLVIYDAWSESAIWSFVAHEKEESCTEMVQWLRKPLTVIRTASHRPSLGPNIWFFDVRAGRKMRPRQFFDSMMSLQDYGTFSYCI
jgi:hypothetical protein